VQVKKARKILIVVERAGCGHRDLTDTVQKAEEDGLAQDQERIQVVGEIEVQFSSSFW